MIQRYTQIKRTKPLHQHFWRTTEVDGVFVTKCETCPKIFKPKVRKRPKMKTPRRKEEQALDLIVKEILILQRGEFCERCQGNKVLQGAHIFPKGTYKRMRWMFLNLLILCEACHIFWWHKNPLDAKRWFDEKFPGRYEQLLLWTRQMPAIDLKEIRISLEIELKQLKN